METENKVTGLQDNWFIMRLSGIQISKLPEQPESGYKSEHDAALGMISLREAGHPDLNNRNFSFTILRLWEAK